MGKQILVTGITETPVLIGGRPVETQPTNPIGTTAPDYLRRQFLKGPVPWPWLCAASRAGTGRSPLAVAVCIRYLAGRASGDTVKLGHKSLEEAGLTRQAAYRGLSALEDAGLVTVERVRGRAPLVTIEELDA